MKTIIKRNPNAQFGFELVFDGKSHAILGIVDDGKTLKLPENPSNRKYWSIAKVDAAGGECELTYKESASFGPRTNTKATPKAPTKGLEEYLEGDDKELYLALVEKANKNRQKAELKAQIEMWSKKLEELGE